MQLQIHTRIFKFNNMSLKSKSNLVSFTL